MFVLNFVLIRKKENIGMKGKVSAEVNRRINHKDFKRPEAKRCAHTTSETERFYKTCQERSKFLHFFYKVQ